jgi:hypothetical protein
MPAKLGNFTSALLGKIRSALTGMWSAGCKLPKSAV